MSATPPWANRITGYGEEPPWFDLQLENDTAFVGGVADNPCLRHDARADEGQERQ